MYNFLKLVTEIKCFNYFFLPTYFNFLFVFIIIYYAPLLFPFIWNATIPVGNKQLYYLTLPGKVSNLKINWKYFGKNITKIWLHKKKK